MSWHLDLHSKAKAYYVSIQAGAGRAAHRVAIGLGLCREQRLHKALLGRLQQGLVLGDHKVPVLGQEVVSLVGDRPGVVLDSEARLAQLGLAEALGAGHLRGLVQPVRQVLVCGLQYSRRRLKNTRWICMWQVQSLHKAGAGPIFYASML